MLEQPSRHGLVQTTACPPYRPARARRHDYPQRSSGVTNESLSISRDRLGLRRFDTAPNISRCNRSATHRHNPFGIETTNITVRHANGRGVDIDARLHLSFFNRSTDRIGGALDINNDAALSPSLVPKRSLTRASDHRPRPHHKRWQRPCLSRHPNSQRDHRNA